MLRDEKSATKSQWHHLASATLAKRCVRHLSNTTRQKHAGNFPAEISDPGHHPWGARHPAKNLEQNGKFVTSSRTYRGHTHNERVGFGELVQVCEPFARDRQLQPCVEGACNKAAVDEVIMTKRNDARDTMEKKQHTMMSFEEEFLVERSGVCGHRWGRDETKRKYSKEKERCGWTIGMSMVAPALPDRLHRGLSASAPPFSRGARLPLLLYF